MFSDFSNRCVQFKRCTARLDGRRKCIQRRGHGGDGLADPIEALLGTNASFSDSDQDGLPDAVEDCNGDSARQWNETSATMQDTDWDNLTDGQEIAGCNGRAEPLAAWAAPARGKARALGFRPERPFTSNKERAHFRVG